MSPLIRERGCTVVRLERELGSLYESGSVGQLARPTPPGDEARVAPWTIETQHEVALAEFRAAGGTDDDLQTLREEGL
jgi:hypothetical protein